MPVRVRPREPFFQSSHTRQRAEPLVRKSRLPGASLGCASNFAASYRRTILSDTRESANPPGLGPGGTRGSTGVSDQFQQHQLPCSSTVEPLTLNQIASVQLRPGLPITVAIIASREGLLTSWKMNRTRVPERSRKPSVPLEGMGSMPSVFRQFLQRQSFRSSADRAPRCEWGGRRCNSCRKHQHQYHPHVAQSRGTCFKSRPVRVQAPPWGLVSAPVAQ